MSENQTNVENENENEEKELNKNNDERFGEKKSLNKNKDKNHKDKETNNDINIQASDEHDNSPQNFDYFVIPEDLTRTLAIVLFVSIFGIFLMGLALVKISSGWGMMNGYVLLFLGFVVFAPGIYYGYQFYKAKTAKFDYARKEILSAIPRI